MHFSFSLLGALLMGASTVSAVDVTGFLNSADCGLTDGEKVETFPWTMIDSQCFTWWDGEQVQKMNSILVTSFNTNDCPQNATSAIFTYHDAECTQVKDQIGSPDQGCTGGGDDGIMAFQHMCCSGGIAPGLCQPH